MRDSGIDPPDAPEGVTTKLNKHVLIALRSGFKAIARPLLPDMVKALYGQELHLGRGDAMPVIAQIIVDYVCLQMSTHPVEFLIEQDTHIIVGVRQTHNGSASAHTTVSRNRGIPKQESGATAAETASSGEL